jgi:predicted ArsR family transcriptional regulator
MVINFSNLMASCGCEEVFAMQETRQHILDILRESGEATVDEITEGLRTRRGKDITAVTVRHHINLLQQEHLIMSSELRRRNTPGRPQHVYILTDKASDHFPNNYHQLAVGLLHQMRMQLPPASVNVILEGVADDMANSALITSTKLEDRLNMAVGFLTENGYEASWESVATGYMLHTHNCPYHHISQDTDLLCGMDMRLVSSLIGVVPRISARMIDGDKQCSYFIPRAANE